MPRVEIPHRSFATPRRTRRLAVPAIAGALLLLAVNFPVDAGDILRGGASMSSSRKNTSTRTNAGAAAAAEAKANAQDRLARTTQALQAVKAMQSTARGLARPQVNLGIDPNHPGRPLPNVPNGLRPGGLDIQGAPVGADAPVQSGSGGKINVEIKQNQQRALLNWKTFNVGKDTTLTFDQSAGKADRGQWIAFNKVRDPSGSPSQILGAIKADGQVYVINQNGIIFGGASQVNVHALVASSLPVNDNLIDRGLLNNPDAQFLLSALAIPTGAKGTPAFTPPAPLTPDGKIGDVVVQAGAQLSSPTSAANIGGRIALVGANVRNEGTISTPDGQTILAAGLQVGFTSHPGSDPTLRGLDVYVGKVGNYGGTAANAGLIDAPRASVVMTGKNVNQLGVIDSSTSVTLNGRIDLLADYDAAPNLEENIFNSFSTGGVRNLDPYLFLPRSAGTVTLGKNSVTRILPEIGSTQTVVGTELPLRSQVNLQGKDVHFRTKAMLLAPNAEVRVGAGRWAFDGSDPTQPKVNFVYSGGQVYLDAGAFLDAAGTPDVSVSILQNILKLQLRGAELADSPLERESVLRAIDLIVDARENGVYDGRFWIGTPLGDVTGFAGLIQRTAAQLTTAGGNVEIQAGGAVVLQKGSAVDVSGGYISYQGGEVRTTRIIDGARVIDIS
ncbi:MAG TPA: filamentous hemagglutinin N-terminal domain-containing protein, partial [Chthoniobacterales bacterium]